MILPWFQACIYWKKSVIWRYQLQPSIFYMEVLLCHGSTWSDPCVKDTVFISQHFLQSSIITTGVWLIQKKLKRCAYLKKAIVAKVPIYSTELVAVIFVYESICNRSILSWQFHSSDCSYLLSILNFLEEQLYTFVLASVTLGTVAFSKELLFRSTYSLNFLSGCCSF